MKIDLSSTKSPDKLDVYFIAFLVVMAITSIIAIYSAFGIIGQSRGMDLISKQIMWFVIGFIMLAILVYLGNDSIPQFAKIAYWILLACLVYLLISKYLYDFVGINLPFVHRANGATSWFLLPGIGTFQPSEFMKIALILVVSHIIDEHNQTNIIDSFENDIKLFFEIGKWVIPPVLLILLQPDTGIVIIIGLSILAMILCSGVKREWFIVIGTLILIVLIIFFYLYFYQFDTLSSLLGSDSAYKLRRITAWLNPETDIGNNGMQLYVALLVMGSAGITGFGPQQLLTHIPEAQTDFIFAVIGQSWGLIGTIFIVILCIGLDLYLCKIAFKTKNMYEKYIITGVLGMLLYQQIQNIGMIIGLLPITGITLPLISYGGSSLLSYFIVFGIILNTSSKTDSIKDI